MLTIEKSVLPCFTYDTNRDFTGKHCDLTMTKCFFVVGKKHGKIWKCQSTPFAAKNFMRKSKASPSGKLSESTRPGKLSQKTNWKDPPCYFHGKIHYFDWVMASIAFC